MGFGLNDMLQSTQVTGQLLGHPAHPTRYFYYSLQATTKVDMETWAGAISLTNSTICQKNEEIVFQSSGQEYNLAKQHSAQ